LAWQANILRRPSPSRVRHFSSQPPAPAIPLLQHPSSAHKEDPLDSADWKHRSRVAGLIIVPRGRVGRHQGTFPSTDVSPP
jgi:hypothetical protein